VDFLEGEFPEVCSGDFLEILKYSILSYWGCSLWFTGSRVFKDFRNWRILKWNFEIAVHTRLTF
jgi:hypothetical protein